VGDVSEASEVEAAMERLKEGKEVE